jgi:uncharacterized membrane protein (DUF2068 family)
VTIATSPDDTGTENGAAPALHRREVRWVLKRCARHGHVLAHLDGPVAARLEATGPDGLLLSCLRCGVFVDPDGPNTGRTTVHGGADHPVPLGDVPLVLRGGHGRKLALLRVLAVERGGRGLLVIVAAAGIAQLAESRVAVAQWLGRLATAAQPLGDQLGWDVAKSPTLTHAIELLGHSSASFLTIAWLLGAYGVLQVVEGVGLWGGWRWAEYLATIATSAFIPIEVHELTVHVTVLKIGALAVNVVAVAYLVWKGRLFGTRGGHRAYLAEVRDATLLADELRRSGRSTAALTSHRLV